MNEPNFSLVIEPEQLKPRLGSAELLVLDLSKASVHQQMHIPGAVFLDYAGIIANRPPVAGLVPELRQLEQLFTQLGVSDRQLVVYDDEGGGKAARLIWTLHLLGHRQAALLNGGLHTWANEGFPLSREPGETRPAPFSAQLNPDVSADADYILARLDQPDLRLLDARGEAEYNGQQRFAARGGHIPGAIHWDWMELMDRDRNLRLRPREVLLAELQDRGINPDHEVVTYCQTHHRSSLSYLVLCHLGLERVRGYPGSWSDWGNRLDLPLEGG